MIEQDNPTRSATGASCWMLRNEKEREYRDDMRHSRSFFRIYVEFDEMSVLKPLYTTVESFGLQVLDTILNNPRNTGNYNAILSIKNPEDRAHEQVAEYLKKIQGVRKVKLIY